MYSAILEFVVKLVSEEVVGELAIGHWHFSAAFSVVPRILLFLTFVS